MDKALVFGTKDCRFESCQSHIWTKSFALFTTAPCPGRSATPSTYAIVIPVGFEPTRGDPIGLAGRRLNHSAKVSLQASGLRLHAGAAILARSSGAACLRAVVALSHCCEWGVGGYIAQLLERLTADQQVPGSNPGVPFVNVVVRRGGRFRASKD